MAARSLMLTATALRPSARGVVQSRRKSTPSTSMSVVRRVCPREERTTAASSPIPTSTREPPGVRERSQPVIRSSSVGRVMA